jgi:hypothetical protein
VSGLVAAWPCWRFVGPENGLLDWIIHLYQALPAVSSRPQILSGLLKCPLERFQRIVQGAGGRFLWPEDGSSQDFTDGVYRLLFRSRQIRPRPHPPDEYPVPPDPGAIEPCLAVSGPINRKSLDCRGFNRNDWTGQGMLAPEDPFVCLLEPFIESGLV